MVVAGLFDRFGLGLFGEAGGVEPAGEGVAFLGRRGDGLFQPRLFGGEIDDAFQRQRIGGVGVDELQLAAARGSVTGMMRARRSMALALAARRVVVAASAPSTL